MDAIENLMTRRSMRSFSNREISRKDLEIITDAARLIKSIST